MITLTVERSPSGVILRTSEGKTAGYIGPNNHFYSATPELDAWNRQKFYPGLKEQMEAKLTEARYVGTRPRHPDPR